ncbi:MAG TPA: ATP-binding protein [Xanthobacteraceae bacterium]|nr:ATP-binding protein [Xanthobacteraceae bacterium]
MQIESFAPAEAGEPETGSIRPPVAAWRPRVLEAFWHRRSVRAQLLMTLIVLDVIAALVAGAVTIVRARTATRIEIAASMTLAGLLVQEAVSLVQDLSPEQVLANLPLRLRYLRHVRILVEDPSGVPVGGAGVPPGAGRADDRRSAPAWFAALIAPPVDRLEVPVIVKGQRLGSAVVMGAPADEIAEVWENTVALGAVAVGLGAVMIGMLYVIFGRVLDPLNALGAGLRDLETRNYKVRLAQPHQRELAAITGRFNALAAALDTVRARNVELGHRLITAQDDERRRTARELHDEVGPCLFGLKANAASIGQAASKIGDLGGTGIAERVHDILSITEHLQSINRGLLNRLRPMALGHVPLSDLIADMVEDRARKHPEVAFAFSPGTLQPSYGEAVDLTVYRCVQEGLTNAIRHALPSHVAVALRQDTDQATGDGLLTLTIDDDGSGILPGTAKGFGLLGMEERLQALGGALAIHARDAGGTRLTIVMAVHHSACSGEVDAGSPIRTSPQDACSGEVDAGLPP